MRRRYNSLRNKIILSEGKIIKTRKFKYIAESVNIQDGHKCNGCALNNKRFECSKMRCQVIKRIDGMMFFENFILKQIE